MPSSNDHEFNATARAYGGRKGYEQAHASGRTTLNYEQWIQTRTPSFKEWFGDWEALRTEARLDAMPAVQVRVPEEWRGLDHVGLREKMSQTLKEMIDSKEPISHPEVGDIRISRLGGRKSASTARDPAKSLIVADLRNVLTQSVVARSAPSETREQGVDGYGTLLARVDVDGVSLVASFSIRLQRDGAWYYNAVALQDPELEKEKGRDSYGSPGALARPLGETPIAGLDQFIRRPLRRVNSQAVSKTINPETGEPMVLYRGGADAFTEFSKAHLPDGAPGLPHLFFTQTPSPAGDPVFLSAKSPDGQANYVRHGDTWLVTDPTQVNPANGKTPPLDLGNPAHALANPSAGDHNMADPIQNESAVYGDTPQAEPDPDAQLVGYDPLDAFSTMANELVIDDQAVPEVQTLAQQAPSAPPAPAEGKPARKRAAKAKDSPAPEAAQAVKAPAKRAKKAAPEAATPAPKASKPKAKAKAVKAPEPAPTPAPPPPGIADLDPHAQQRLDRVSANRATDLAQAQKQLDAEAATRARVHLIQDPIGRHIVAVDQGGVTKAYSVDKDLTTAARAANKLRDGVRSIGNFVGEARFLPDVIKTRFRVKSGEERIVYNVDPEGVDPQHSQMREAGLGENDRRNLVVIPEGKPQEVNNRVLLSSDLPDAVKKRYVHSDTVPGQFFDRNRKLAFIDKGGRLATDQNEPEIINSMISVAQAKGWKAITVKGHEEFRREAWLTASLAGIEVKGFTPSEPDLARLEHERQQRMTNAIQPATPAKAPVSNEIEGAKPEATPPTLSAESIALGEVARLKGVREDQIPNFMKAAEAFIVEARKAGLELPALKVFDPQAPAAPTVTIPEKAKEPTQGISIPEPEKAPKR